MKIFLIVIACIFFLSLVWAVGYGYLYKPFLTNRRQSANQCDGIPKNSVALALGFTDNGRIEKTIIPGDANTALAGYIAAHNRCFSMVLTQQSIIAALTGGKEIVADESVFYLGQTPVYLMHRHDPSVEVRTLEALRYALNRLAFQPEHIVLIAHDKHFLRAYLDLRSIYPADQIINPYLAGIPYQNPNPFNAFFWSWREFIAIPFDWIRCSMVLSDQTMELQEKIPPPD
jgi:hypothetical protein